MNSSKVFKFSSCLLALLATVAILTAPAGAYEDYIYHFSVSGPKKWAVLPNASVPGSFRFGWTSPEWARPGAKNVFGASIAVFVKDAEGNSARDLLEKNVAVITGGANVPPQARVHPSAKLKVLKQELISVDGNQGFVMEVVGNGTGFAIGVPITPKGTKTSLQMVPTRQRWYCIVKGKYMIGVLSTSPDSLYSKYATTFAATEGTLKVRDK